MTNPTHTPDPQPTPDLIPLKGARLLHASEPSGDAIWQEGLIKQMTEGEPMRVRRFTGGLSRFRRVRLRMQSALLRLLGRALMTGGTGTVSRGDPVAQPAPCCRKGEGQ